MIPKFEYGAEVRVLRNLRNDGTFPDTRTGELLIRRGSVGYVRDVGTYLQEYIVYAVHFMDADKLVGCREEELQFADLPWVPNKFEFRDWVSPTIPLGMAGDVVASPGENGQILKVLRDAPGGISYHLRINGRTLQVPETALEAAPEETAEALEAAALEEAAAE
ncbi:MAG: nitrogen fixation protein NifZ [Magnetospiraceae bacterium]